MRLDTNIATHDKILTLLDSGAKGKQAGFVYAMSIAHSAGHGTDGVIKRSALPFIHGTAADAKLLVMAELWECIEGGYRIKNWGNRNVVGAAQQALSEIRSEAGKKGAEARWND
ncbi:MULTISPECIES: hypothetical protein [unclassified Rhodococcus (in: high G+C Gram-positive bacteria)]|uniref:hypothetical protein n=1 Tax=unclassified Rhodococcus (in: high G+C Gram-positive bacteria) TaxID=192944 RepID=UPI0020CB74B6|nr:MULTISPECIES: hypothetical protein [unclassified Rhodococcus (in: high G+C Gram-positive bacteria)]